MATGPISRNAMRYIAINMAIASPKKKQELERQFKINPEVNTRLEAFMQAEPELVQFVKTFHENNSKRKFLLRKMQDEQQKQGYQAKVKAWLDKPEQADLVKSIKAIFSPHETREARAGTSNPGEELHSQHRDQAELKQRRRAHGQRWPRARRFRFRHRRAASAWHRRGGDVLAGAARLTTEDAGLHATTLALRRAGFFAPFTPEQMRVSSAQAASSAGHVERVRRGKAWARRDCVSLSTCVRALAKRSSSWSAKVNNCSTRADTLSCWKRWYRDGQGL